MKLEQIEHVDENVAFIAKTVATLAAGAIAKMVIKVVKHHGKEFVIDLVMNCKNKNDSKFIKGMQMVASKFKSYEKSTITKHNDECEMVFTFDDEKDMLAFKKMVEEAKHRSFKLIKTTSTKKNQ